MKLRSFLCLAILSAPLGAQDGTFKLWTREPIHSAKLNQDRGHSFGGLTALEVATKRPGTFTGVIAMSPSLWWNDSSLVVTYYDALAKSAKPERVFVTSGGLEGDIDRPTTRLALRLDSLKSSAVAFGHQRYPDDTHGLTPAPSLVDGLRFVFEPIAVTKLPISSLGPSTDSADVIRAVNESIRRYAAGAHTFGMDERLPEMQLNEVGYGVLQVLKNPALAVWAFRSRYSDRAHSRA